MCNKCMLEVPAIKYTSVLFSTVLSPGFDIDPIYKNTGGSLNHLKDEIHLEIHIYSWRNIIFTNITSFTIKCIQNSICLFSL